MNAKTKSVISFLRQAVFGNVVYKTLAIVFAIVCWYLIQGREIIEINRQVRVSLIIPDGYGVKGPAAIMKDATLRGSRSDLAKITRRIPLEAEIHISEERRGSFRMRLDKEHIANWNERVKLTVHEAYIKVEVDKLITKEVPIEIFMQGVPAEDYIIEKATIEPDSVTIIGLHGETSKIQKVLTLPVDIDGLQKNRSFVVGLAGSNDDISYEIEEVKVTLQVGEKKINQKFEGIAVEATGGQPAKIDPPTVAITVQGIPAVLEFMDARSFQAFVDIEGLGVGRHERKVIAKIPESTVLIETLPENIFVEIKNNE